MIVALALGQLAACGGGSDSGVGPPDDGAASVDSLVLSLDSAEVIIDDTLRLNAEARNAGGEPVPGVALVWSSTDTSVATVSSDGLVTAVELGEAEIEVAVAGASQLQGSTTMAQLAVAGAQQRGRSRAKIFSVPKVVISPGEQTVDVGAVVPYAATITNLNDRQLRNRPETRWSSSDPSVASIDATGTATALKEGTTSIRATVTVGRSYNYSKSVPLHIGVCSGITDVQEWNASVDVTYRVTKSIGRVTFSVSHQSSGTATLSRVAGEPRPTWEGAATGQASINNRMTDAEAGLVGSETATNSPVGGIANIRLELLPPSELLPPGEPGNACEYRVRYQDEATYTATLRQGQPQTVRNWLGIARSFRRAVGPKPPTGWKLERTDEIPGLLLGAHVPDPDDELPGLPLEAGYIPLTSISLSMFANDRLAVVGTAAFKFSLTAK